MRLVSTDQDLVDSLVARALHGALVPTATCDEVAAELVEASLDNRGALTEALTTFERVMATKPSRTAARAIADVRAAIHRLEGSQPSADPTLRLVS